MLEKELVFVILKGIFSIIFIVDYSGIVDVIKRKIWTIFNGKKIRYKWFSLKPFDCVICLSFWFSLFYLLFNNINIIDTIFYSTFASFFSIFMGQFIDFIYLLVCKLFDQLKNKLKL